MATNNSTTFQVTGNLPNTHYYNEKSKTISQTEEIKKIPGYEKNKCTEILQMTNLPEKVCFSKNGFVNTVVDAYNNHYNLVIRPDDVWAAIMTQFSFYINKHAEKFRSKFVKFKGKKELVVTTPGSLRSAPYDTFVPLMTEEIDRNLTDPKIKSWILPNFSTTTDNDLVAMGVVFMATMKKYFHYSFNLMCGIPSVTLEGTLQDWENLCGRLDKLKKYNLHMWYDMLKPILQQFVMAKKGQPDVDFWRQIADYSASSGAIYISGWITTFCVFDTEGNWQGGGFGPDAWFGYWLNRFLPLYSDEGWFTVREVALRQWFQLDTDKIPDGVVEVNVKINEVGMEHNAILIAGHIGTEIKGIAGDTVQPAVGWLIALQ